MFCHIPSQQSQKDIDTISVLCQKRDVLTWLINHPICLSSKRRSLTSANDVKVWAPIICFNSVIVASKKNLSLEYNQFLLNQSTIFLYHLKPDGVEVKGSIGLLPPPSPPPHKWFHEADQAVNFCRTEVKFFRSSGEWNKEGFASLLA